MGMNLDIKFSFDRVPTWHAIEAALADRRLHAEMRMIDGELALPTEIPADDWQELRLSMMGGMVTVARRGDALSLVVWGHADKPLIESRDRLAWALAAAGDGQVCVDGQHLSADAFAQAKSLSGKN